MNIIVTVKQVPDTNDVKIDPVTGTLVREGVPSIVNPEDRNAAELALELREAAGGGHITAISMGPLQAESALREILAMGVDEAVLLSDRAFAGADTLATAAALAYAIKKLGKYDLIVCGRQAIDGDTAQVGPQLAECLQIPQATYVLSAKFSYGGLLIDRKIDGAIQRVTAPLPLLLTCIKETNVPRIPTLGGCMSAYREKKFTVWSAKDIEAVPERIGAKGSPTQVQRTFTPPAKGEGRILTGEPAVLAKLAVEILAEKGLV